MTVIVIGAGQAGLQTIMSLRQNGYDGGITLIGDEAFLLPSTPAFVESLSVRQNGTRRAVFEAG